MIPIECAKKEVIDVIFTQTPGFLAEASKQRANIATADMTFLILGLFVCLLILALVLMLTPRKLLLAKQLPTKQRRILAVPRVTYY